MTRPLALTLNLASFSAGARLEPSFVRELTNRVAQTFREACGDSLGLRIVADHPHAGPAPGSARVTARQLHDFARQLNRNPEYWGDPRRAGPPVASISAIFAEYYAPETKVLGVMFDRGFATGDDGNTSRLYTGVPREACAIFIGAARELRRSDADIAEEIWFTTTHELGHIFNLQHTLGEATYLSQSPSRAPYRWRQVDFSHHHKSLLRQCHTNPLIWPGGSDFADASPYGHHDVPLSRDKRRELGNLELKIAPSRYEFYRFEPIELDVKLKRPASAGTSISIPNCIDPGYDQFRIWIEQPNGERRLYRSPRRYCPNGARFRLDPGKVFERDISIFGESGGYTFRAPGIYSLTAELDIGKRGIVRSNTVELNVLPYRPGKPSFERASSVFATSIAADVLYHRSTSHPRALPKLAELCSTSANVPGIESLRYAIGLAWLSAASRAKGATQQRTREQGVQQLRRAVRRPSLGWHRIERAERILDELARQPQNLQEALWKRGRESR